ncbi:hypothetical protein QN277_026837 [Acacia crassicarpa]|uniref:Bet v I/Major latex protein domain-containing protein n=1 Tax=Acacia crassicarpa TaxID=499986 RepID=A0AAE1MMC0_9FABA|nr:hypothetical protein QN277_026837 [Acacia crassicarpa]
MGVFTYHNESTLSVTRSRLFKAVVLDFDNIIPKIMKMAQNIEILEGNGGPGTLRKITYVEGGETKYVVEKWEATDEEKYVYSYSVIEGSGLAEGVEKITIEQKFEEGADGGCVGKDSITFFTKFDAPPTDVVVATITAIREGHFRALEAYLLAHPHEY